MFTFHSISCFHSFLSCKQSERSILSAISVSLPLPPTPTKTWQRSGLIWVILFKHVLLVRLWSMAAGVGCSVPRLSSKTPYWCHPLVIKENAPPCSSLRYRLSAHVAFSSALACPLLALSFGVRINKMPVVTSYMGLISSLYWHQENIPRSDDRVRLQLKQKMRSACCLNRKKTRHRHILGYRRQRIFPTESC